MLIQFRVRNYKCFRDEQVLSLVASSFGKLPENVIFSPAGAKLNLLRSAVIYGANASGKTSLLDALVFVWHFVRDSAKKSDDGITIVPFILDSDALNRPSEFELTFICQGIRYQFGFAATMDRVVSENLYYWPKGRSATLYQRQWCLETDTEEFYFGPSLKGQNEQVRKLTRPDALFLSVASTFNHPQLSEICDWFRRNIRGLSMPYLQNRPIEIRPGDDLHGRSRQLLQLADLGIDDYEIQDVSEMQDDGLTEKNERIDPITKSGIKRRLQINMLHHASDQETIPIPLALESNGTLNIFRISTTLFGILDREGSLLSMSLAPVSILCWSVPWLNSL
jgi:hypothetical protein